jgi:hypothetical protein
MGKLEPFPRERFDNPTLTSKRSNVEMYQPNPETIRNISKGLVRRTGWWKLALFVSLLAITLVTAGCFEGKIVTTKVEKLPPNAPAPKMNGVFYALPRTVVKVDVPVNRVEKTPGEFVEFTPCFFPNENFIASPSKEFGIAADKIKFDTTFIPDTQQVYMIKTNGGKFETKSLELALTESGVFVKASAETTNQAIDVLTSTIKSGVGLLAKASGLGILGSEAESKNRLNENLRNARLDCIKQLEKHKLADETDAKLKKRDERVASRLKAAASPKPKPTPRATPTFVLDPCGEGGDDSACDEKFQKALALFQQIATLQARRTAILDTATPNATVPADTLKLMLDELDKTIKDLKQSGFLGTKDTLTWTGSFRLNPIDPAKMSVQLFSILKDEGICAILAPDQGVFLSQLDPRFTRKNKPCSKPGKPVWLEMKKGEDGEGGPGGSLLSDKVKDARLKQTGDRGLYYRVPGRAFAFIYQESAKARSKDELGRAPLSIAQFGEVVSLPASAGGRKTKYTLDLYESSGGLKNFVMGSSALIEKTNVEDLTGAAETAIEAKGERKKAKEPASELDQLKQQREILEEKKKIRDLQKALDETGAEGSSPQ